MIFKENNISEKKLNKQQLNAVTYNNGPLLIIAGAGTGKTTVITEKIKWLITEQKIKPEEILALTFTEKAAHEMEERLDQALPIGYREMWVMTFHAFGERVLKDEAIQIGITSDFKLHTNADTIIFLRDNLFNFDLKYFRPLGNPKKFLNGLANHFSRLKDEDVTPKDYIIWAEKNRKNNKISEAEIIDSEKYLELAYAYSKYEELKIKNGVLDFSDLIFYTLKLFRKRKNILKNYQEKFKYILIDEFQDTNFAQNQLAVILSENHKNITVVGDDDQAIYRWRGAAISNILQFKKYFPQAKVIVLSKNYRSSKNILDASYKMIQSNNPDRLEVKEDINKKLESVRNIDGEKIEFLYSQRAEDEADAVAKKIKQIIDQKSDQLSKYYWKDIAVLVRANNHADSFIKAFSRLGIPYQFLGPGQLFRQNEVRDLIAYLKLLNNPSDSVVMYRVLSMPIFEISPRDIAFILSFARKTGLSLFETIEVIIAEYTKDQSHWSNDKNYFQLIPSIDKKTKEKLFNIMQILKHHLLQVKTETAGQIIYSFLEKTGMLKQFTDIDSLKKEKEVINISKFFDKLKNFEFENEDASVNRTVEWIETAMELGESPLVTNIDWTENNAVNILTIHSAKGLEFKVVFIVNLTQGRFPTYERKEQIPIPDDLIKEILPEGDYHLEEERRLFYVAMTRARDKLIFSASAYYGQAKRERRPSPFLYETLGDGIERILKKTNKETGQLSFFNWKKEKEAENYSAKTKLSYLSYSQIDTFLTCPLQYKYRYILKIPVMPSAAGSFGSSMHEALQKFYEKRLANENLNFKDLLAILDKVWTPVGYGSRAYEKKMKQRGREMLKGFYEKVYDPRQKPLSLEQVFKISLNSNLKLGGKIDRVDNLQEGRIEIIDYKTGKKPKEKEIRENLQMTVYALAATDSGIYNKKSSEVVLSFYFFETFEKISSTRTDQDLQSAKEKIIKTAKEIENSSFEPKVSNLCDFCDYRMICKAWQ